MTIALFLSAALNGLLLVILMLPKASGKHRHHSWTQEPNPMPILEGFQPIIDNLNSAAQSIEAAKVAMSTQPSRQDVLDTLTAVTAATNAVVTAAGPAA